MGDFMQVAVCWSRSLLAFCLTLLSVLFDLQRQRKVITRKKGAVILTAIVSYHVRLCVQDTLHPLRVRDSRSCAACVVLWLTFKSAVNYVLAFP